MNFAADNYIFLLFIFPIFIILNYLYLRHKKKKFKEFVSDEKSIEFLTLKIDKNKLYYKNLFYYLSLVFILLAVSRPQFGTKIQNFKRKGLDIVILIDISNSMLAQDIKPSRLSTAKYLLKKLITKYLKGDRVGIVAFSGETMVNCPLTLDYNAALGIIDSLNPSLLKTKGTAIGEAIRTGKLLFQRKELKHKAMILLTDGEDHNTNPIEMAEEAKKEGVRIFSIGIGSYEGVPIPLGKNNFQKDVNGNIVTTKLNDSVLKKIALITNGAYFRLSKYDLSLELLYKQITKMEKKTYNNQQYVLLEDRYQFFLLIGVILMFIEMFLFIRNEKKKIKTSYV